MQMKCNLLLICSHEVLKVLCNLYKNIFVYCRLFYFSFQKTLRGQFISSIYSDSALQSKVLLNAFQAVPIEKLC